MDNFLDLGLENYVVLDEILHDTMDNQVIDGSWKMYFDGSCSKNGYGIGIVIESPDAKIYAHSFKLKLKCTNNEAKHGALIQGLEFNQCMRIKCLCIMGYFELVVNHIKNKYGIKKCRLKTYAKKVWDLIDSFEAFNIIFIHRVKNHQVDSLVVSTSVFLLDVASNENSFQVKALFWPTIPNNNDSLQFFDNDEKMMKFLASLEGEENKNTSLEPKDKIDNFH